MILDWNTPKKASHKWQCFSSSSNFTCVKSIPEHGNAKSPLQQQTTPSTSLKNKQMLISELQVLLKCQHVKLLKSQYFPLTYMYMPLHIKMCVIVCLGFFSQSLCKKNGNMNSPVVPNEFSPAPTLKRAFLSANLCTETQLKAFMLQLQFTAKWLGEGKSLQEN